MKETFRVHALLFCCLLAVVVAGCMDLTTTSTVAVTGNGTTTTVAGTDPNEALVREILSQRPDEDVILPGQLPEGWHVASLEELSAFTKDIWGLSGEGGEIATNPEAGFMAPEEEWDFEGGTYYRVLYTDGVGLVAVDLDAYSIDAFPVSVDDMGLTFEGAPWVYSSYPEAPDAPPEYLCSFESEDGWHNLSIVTYGPVLSGVPLYLIHYMKRYSASRSIASQQSR